jgi:hypothetical protein
MSQETAKHSPGPWRVGGPRTGPTTARINGPTVAGRDWDCEHVTRNLETIAIVPRQVDGALEGNASLIAAAPDLLEALKAALDAHHSGAGRWVGAAMAAIAKAEARS